MKFSYNINKSNERCKMINFILLYKIRSTIKKFVKEKLKNEEIALTKNSCLSCFITDLSWEIYYLLKEESEKKK